MKQFLQLIRPFREMRKIVVLCLVMVMAMGAAWGQTKITDYTNIVSGTRYYIGATTGGTDYYLSVNGSSLTTSIAGTAVTSMNSATPFTFSGSGTTWTIQFDNGYYLSLKSTKDNGKVQVVDDAANFTASNQSSKIRLQISGANYSIQKNNSGTQFGSYGNTQTDIWLVEVPSVVTNYTVTFDAGDGTFVGSNDFPNVSNTVAAGTYTLPSATPASGYTFDGWLPTGSSTPVTGSYTVSGDVDFTASYTENTTPTPGGNLVIDFESTASTYTDWTFANMTSQQTTDITAHAGTYYGTTGGKATASITTNTPIATPGSLTCYVSKQTTNTTASTWYIQVSSDGGTWTDVETTSATDMTKGVWKEFTADLSSYTNVYVRVYYSGSTAVRNIDDLTLTTSVPSVAAPTFDPVSGTEFGDEGLSVTLSCETEGASIYYTLDGSTPDNTSTLYNGVINLTTTSTINAVAYDGTDYSNVTTATYTYVDPNAPGTVNNPYTVAQAIANTPSNGNVYIRGIVSSFYNTSITGDGSNYRYYISDDGTTSTELLVYRGKGLNQATFTNANDLLVGDEVVIYGSLITYQNTPEVAQDNYLYSWNRPAATVEAPVFDPVAGTYAEAQTVTISCETQGATIYYTTDGTEPTDASTEYTAALTISTATTVKAIAYVGSEASIVSTAIYHICSADNPYTVAQALDFDEYPANGIYVHGIVSTAPTSLNNGTLTYYISEDGEAEDELEIYKGKNLENTDFTAVGDIQVGDIVTIYGNVKIYNNFKEFDQGNYIVSFERPVPVLEPYDLTVSTLNEHINAIYVFDANNQNDPLIEEGLAGTVQVLEGTDIIVSPDVEAGYVLTALTVLDGEGESVQPENHMSEGGYYSFTMPSGPVTISATAVEYVAPTPGNWMLTNLSELTEDDVFVIVGDNGDTYALSNDKGTSSAPTAVAVTVVEGTLSEEPAANLQWNLGITNGGYAFYPNGTTESWLYCINSNNGVRVGTNTNNVFVLDNESNYLKNVATSRYIGVYNSQDWRCYTNTTGNIANQTFAFYKKVELAEPVVYFFEGTGDCEVVSLTGSSITLPDAENTDGWAFAGWSTAAVNESATAPATLVTSPYAPAEDMPLYAVYAKDGVYSTFPAVATTQLDVTETFDTYTQVTAVRTNVKPTGWTVVTQYDPVAKTKNGRPELLKEASYAHSGNYSMFMDSLSLLVMPKLAEGINLSEVEMELYVRQPFDYQYLEVGVMSDLTDPNSFELVTTINNVGMAVNRRVVDFSGHEGQYIAFRNKYTEESVENGMHKSFNYIDDITIRTREESNCGITSLPNAWSFEADSSNTSEVESCWTLVNRDGYYDSQYDPQIQNYACYSNSGQSSLKLDGRCVYAMPEFKVDGNVISDIQMELYVRQSSSSCGLQVGVMSDLNDLSSFVSLETLSNGGATGHQRHVIDFRTYQIPQGAKYIAFRNVYDGTWGRSPQYIDDIELSIHADCGITSLPSVWSFESDSSNTSEVENCWTLVSRVGYGNSQYDPHVQNYACYSNASQSSLMLDGRCVYAMPEFKVEGMTIGEIQMEFYVRQYSSACSLEVGVMSNVNNANSFISLATISNEGASGHQSHVIDFSEYTNLIPSDAKYIAFRNVYDGTWGRSPQYLDDITLSVPEAKIAEVFSENEIDAMDVERYLEDIKVYPNPTRGNLYIDAMDVQKVECYNQMGQLVGVYDNANELNIGDLSNGVYMFRITVPQGVTMRKVVKK